MAIVFHTLESDNDLDRISEFLIRHYQSENQDGNWIYPIWEYAYTHPGLDPDDRHRVGIWEDAGEIVGATIIETIRNDIALCTHPGYRRLKPEMLEYAESNLFLRNESGKKILHVFVHDYDAEHCRLMAEKGYEHESALDRPMSKITIADAFPDGLERRPLPDSYGFGSLQEEFDLRKMNRVLYRGFNHPGEPDEADLEGRRLMVSGPRFRPELTTVIAAPNGNWVTYCGMWYDEVNKFGYVEPVATDPDYRRRGLGSATVLEGIRRCGLEGADTVFVWNDTPFYLSIGFRVMNTHLCWTREY